MLFRSEACAQGVLEAKSTQRKQRTARDAADGVLLEQVRSLVAELEIILKPDDVRWMDFVAAVPGDERRPEPVDVIVVKGGGPGVLEVDWESATRAQRYQVETRPTGQPEFKRLVTVKDTNATLTGLPAGTQLEVRVVSVNDAGEAAPSDAVSVTVPALENVA